MEVYSASNWGDDFTPCKLSALLQIVNPKEYNKVVKAPQRQVKQKKKQKKKKAS